MRQELIQTAKDEIAQINPDNSYIKIMYEVAAIITTLMDKLDTHPNKINKPIIVGGLSMEFHTDSAYTTRDIDFVTSASLNMPDILLELGFEKESRIYIYDKLNIAVDIAGSHLEPYEAYSRVIKVQVGKNYFYVISPEDIVIDRILDYQYEDNYNYCLILVIKEFETLDFDYIRREITWDKDALKAFNDMVSQVEQELNSK